MKKYEGVKVQLDAFLTSVADVGEPSDLRPTSLLPGK
jgi:hypothetical protein